MESGDFEILVGKSSREILLKETVKVESTILIPKRYDRNSLVRDFMDDPDHGEIYDELMKKISENKKIQRQMEEDPEFISKIFDYMPLRGLVYFLEGAFTDVEIEEILRKTNYFKTYPNVPI